MSKVKKIEHEFKSVTGSRVCGHTSARLTSWGIDFTRCNAPKWKHQDCPV